MATVSPPVNRAHEGGPGSKNEGQLPQMGRLSLFRDSRRHCFFFLIPEQCTWYLIHDIRVLFVPFHVH